MKAAYDAAQVTAAERPLLQTLPPGTLMQRAARGLARRCAQLLGRVYGSQVVLLVGAGNNGADTLYAGAELARRGAQVTALLTAERAADDPAHAAFAGAGGRSAPAGSGGDQALIDAADLVVDGMVGIGGAGALRAPQARLAELTHQCDAVVVAVDVPSGVDASTGAVAGVAVRADVTVTFGAWKIGLLVDPGAQHAGAVDLVDIGLALPQPAVTAYEADDVADLLPVPTAETDKYRRGVVGVVAGSDRYTGAAVLAVGAALATGVGMVRYVGAAHAAEMVRMRWPEAVVSVAEPGDVDTLAAAGRVQAWVCGPGLGTDDRARATVAAICAGDEPVLLDADALTIVAADDALVRSRQAPTVLTPHAGEFARLRHVDREDVEAHRLEHARAAANDLQATVLLKGSTTVVASADGTVRVNTATTPLLATAGSGDVLSGVCGSLLAGGIDADAAAAAGAFLHGLAGLLAAGEPAVPITASDLLDTVPLALRAVRG
jgi:hydroxyethylthiazole kinase-like uncharacterized protein yjeF